MPDAVNARNAEKPKAKAAKDCSDLTVEESRTRLAQAILPQDGNDALGKRSLQGGFLIAGVKALKTLILPEGGRPPACPKMRTAASKRGACEPPIEDLELSRTNSST